MKYEVIIVGAGIAGTYAASLLSEKGIKVLIVDKEPNEHTAFCGELTDLNTVRQLGISINSNMITKKDYKNIKIKCRD